jgi:single-strand DNA-binding protein
MASLNRIELIGNLGADPDLKYTNSNRPVVNLSVATTEKWKDAAGKPDEKTEWHRVVCWGDTAENVAKYLKKGSPVFVAGRLESREYEKDGIKRRVWEVKAMQVLFLPNGQRAQAAPACESEASPPPSDEDIPF